MQKQFENLQRSAGKLLYFANDWTGVWFFEIDGKRRLSRMKLNARQFQKTNPRPQSAK